MYSKFQIYYNTLRINGHDQLCWPFTSKCIVTWKPVSRKPAASFFNLSLPPVLERRQSFRISLYSVWKGIVSSHSSKELAMLHLPKRAIPGAFSGEHFVFRLDWRSADKSQCAHAWPRAFTFSQQHPCQHLRASRPLRLSVKGTRASRSRHLARCEGRCLCRVRRRRRVRCNMSCLCSQRHLDPSVLSDTNRSSRGP